MTTAARWCLVAASLTASSVWAETELPLADPGFEQKGEGWTGVVPEFARLTAEAAHTGEIGLRIEDKSTQQGSSVRSAPIAIEPGESYAVRFWGRAVAHAGVAVYVDLWNAAGTMITTQDRKNQIVYTVPGDQTSWKQFTIAIRAPEDAARLTLWIHSFNGSVASADFDDFSVSRLTKEEAMAVRTTPSAARSSSEFRIPSKERIAELAGMLQPKPAGLWRPITDRPAWDSLRECPGAPGVLVRAEKYADGTPPDVPDDLYLEFSRNGNRTNYQRPYGLCSSRISSLVVAECLENKGRFLPAIERDMLAMCEHRSWVMPAHDSSLSNFHGKLITVDLGSSARAWMLADSLYWLGGRLSAETRLRVDQEVRRRVLAPYLAALRSGATRGNWWIRGSNNWNAVCNAGVVGAALALLEPPAERAEFLAGMEVSNPYFLSGFTNDGYCSEGMGYWNYGFGHYMMLGIMVRDATSGRLDIFTDPKLKAIAAFPLNILIQPTIAPAFADCGVNSRPSSGILAMIDRVFPAVVPGEFVLPDPVAASITHIGFHAPGWQAPKTPPAILHEHLPVRSWFAEAGILVSRGHPDADVPFGAAVKGGHNAEHHNHNDIGSFTVVLAGKPLLLDPGGEVYTRRTFSSRRYESKVLNSYGHPVPVVAGTLQSTGRNARADVLETEFTDAADRLVLDLAKGYAVGELTSLVRTFVHNRTSRTITVEDRVAFSEPKPFETCLVTFNRVHRRAPDTFVVYDAEHAVEVKVTVEGGDWSYACEEIENPGRPSPKRLGFSLSQPVASARVRLSVQPAELSGDLPGVYAEPAWEGKGPAVDRAVVIQAEDLTTQSGGEVEVCEKIGAEGKALKFWDDPGHALQWKVNVPGAGRYAVLVRCCHDSSESVTRRLLIDGKPAGDAATPLAFPNTGGWSSKADDWRDVWLAQAGKPVVVDLASGDHTVTLVNEAGGGLNLDWIKLVPLGD